jgi:hypothetical protein
MIHWVCDNRHCNVTADGLGHPIGLRAIGWRIEVRDGFSAPIIECPIHRTDGIPGHDAAVMTQELIK